MKRVTMTSLILLILASTGWSKIKKDEQEYFDAQFEALKAQISALQDQNKTLAAQVSALNAQLVQVQKTQGETTDLIHHDAIFLQDVNQTVSMNQMTHEQDLNTMKEILNLLRSQQQQLTAATGNSAQTSPPMVVVQGATPSAPPVVPQTAIPVQVASTQHFYVVLVDGEKYTLGLGSAQGVKVGTRLAVYKISAPTAKIGELEVTDIVDDNDCHARLASVNPGITIEANDIVGPQ